MTCFLSHSDFLEVIVMLIHPVHIELTDLVVQVLVGSSGICWLNEECINRVLEALTAFKNTYNMQNK
jgi:hypothetical protein